MPWFNLPGYNTGGVGGNTTAVNPSIGLRVTDPNSPNYGKVLGSASSMALYRSLSNFSIAERQLSQPIQPQKSNIKWLIVSLGLVIGYLLLKRK
jgi:hypothetical protein